MCPTLTSTECGNGVWINSKLQSKIFGNPTLTAAARAMKPSPRSFCEPQLSRQRSRTKTNSTAGQPERRDRARIRPGRQCSMCCFVVPKNGHIGPPLQFKTLRWPSRPSKFAFANREGGYPDEAQCEICDIFTNCCGEHLRALSQRTLSGRLVASGLATLRAIQEIGRASRHLRRHRASVCSV